MLFCVYKERVMNVLFIEWQELPEEVHLDILKNIPIGRYINNLPCNTGDHLSYKIPIPTPTAMAKLDAKLVFDTAYIEFRKHRLAEFGDKYPYPIAREMYAWERVV